MSVNSRDEKIIQIRPKISSAQVLRDTSSVEAFQNTVLRPLLKFQNEHIVSTFLMELKSKKQYFNQLNNLEKASSLDHHFKSNMALKQQLLGIVIALFTAKELITYHKDSSIFNKRIFSMLKERLKDQLISLN
ncbi:hypothetical protein N9K44_00410 [Flavobacteriaceae bacterium]|nr:hypothetical protein [Flavobacteriaceae bacterium]